MIKKYTFLFLLLAFFFKGTNVIFAMPLSNGNYSEIADPIADYSFPEAESQSAYGSSRQAVSTDGLSIEEQAVWATNGSIYIRARKDVEVNIYTITGQLTKRVKVTAGETAIPMSRGLYIVRFDNVARKVIVR